LRNRKDTPSRGLPALPHGLPTLPKAKTSGDGKVLLQTQVDLVVATQFDALARANGHKRAAYLRHLIELHVNALTPELLRALKRTQARVLPKTKTKTVRKKESP